MKTLEQLAGEVATARRRFAAMGHRPAGVERVTWLRAAARLDAAEMAVALAQALPGAAFGREVETAVQFAIWGVSDVAVEMRPAPRIRSAAELMRIIDRERAA